VAPGAPLPEPIITAFDYGYPEIAAIVGRSEESVRQLATRARRHVEQRRPGFQTTG
jgi:RNA polymerase sigma-70 factor (ECF subfamily)